MSNIKSVFGLKWKNVPELEDLLADLAAAAVDHDNHMQRVGEWLDLLHIKTKSGKFGIGRSAYESKLIRKTEEWRYASLSEAFLADQDLFIAQGGKSRAASVAKQDALTLNAQFDTQLDKTKFIDTLVRKCANEGTAIIRSGWKETTRYQEVISPKYEVLPTREPTDIAKLSSLSLLSGKEFDNIPDILKKALDKTKETQIPHIPQEVDIAITTEKVKVENRPNPVIRNNFNVYFDPTCGDDLSEAGYAIDLSLVTKADIISNPNYKRLDEVDWGSACPDTDPHYTDETNTLGTTKQAADSARSKVVLYEYFGYWDIEDDGILAPIVATWVGNTIIGLDLSPYPDGKLPFDVIPFMPIDGSIYGEPDAELIGDDQKAKGALTRSTLDIISRHAMGQKGYKKNALDPENLLKFKRGDSFEFGSNINDPSSAVWSPNMPEIPASTFQLLASIDNEASSLSGVQSFGAGGISGAAYGNVSSLGNAALSAEQQRELGIIRRLGNGLGSMGKKLIAMNRVYLSKKEVEEITGMDYIAPAPNTLTSINNLRVSAAGEVLNTHQANRLEFLLQTSAQVLGGDFVRIMLVQIAKLRRMPALADTIESYQPQQNPMDDVNNRLDVIERLVSIRKDFTDGTKIQAETDKVKSETDQNNLDYIEQQSGIEQQRNVEVVQAQAQSNINRDLFNKLLQVAIPDETSQVNN